MFTKHVKPLSQQLVDSLVDTLVTGITVLLLHVVFPSLSAVSVDEQQKLLCEFFNIWLFSALLNNAAIGYSPQLNASNYKINKKTEL